MSTPLFGWDLLVKSVESQLQSNEDILLCFTHLVLISNGFKCVGLGESKVLDGNENKTEALPAGWNEAYALRYIYQGRLYNLKCTKLDGEGVMINLLRVDERSTSLVQLNNDSVARRNGTLEQMLPNYEDLATLIKSQLIDKIIVSKKSRETSCQTDRQPAAQQPPSHPYAHRNSDPLAAGPFRPVGVGETDLNPFGRHPLGVIPPIGGGGMLFEPPGVGRMPPMGGPSFGLPPGAIPPGARFDPFRPPDIDRFPRRPNNRPDNDEMPPPGYDDMFM